ncbi:hypothetical protein Javan202_0035 [Streptococcus phage Javan202]|nr:hypothetical protein Javan202_0035 [Streptococcus phage Javan202]
MYEEGLNCKPLKCASQYDKGYGNGIAFAINLLDKLDEPEKPVLTKKEAEWVDRLTDFYSLPDALYYITRCGYGYLFVFEMAKKTYELPVDSGATYGEFCKLKERLVNAVIYGYEVKKEKLYTVSLKKSGIGIGVQQQDGSFKERFAKEELKEYGFDNLDEYEVEEVEG